MVFADVVWIVGSAPEHHFLRAYASYQVGTIRVWEDLVGHFKGELLIASESTAPGSVGPVAEAVELPEVAVRNRSVSHEDVFELPFSADTLESAFNAIKTYLQREFPRQTRRCVRLQINGRGSGSFRNILYLYNDLLNLSIDVWGGAVKMDEVRLSWCVVMSCLCELL